MYSAKRKAQPGFVLLGTFLFSVALSVSQLINFINFAVVASAHAADINYIYDELGRLRAVVDPNSDTAVYNYDAVGNLLSITRQASTVVSVIEFTPNSGPVGTVVTVFGTGFSATPGQNTVTFNGVTASVTSSTTTKIVTTVPSSATTGPIAVTSPSGSAASSSVFTVTNSTGAPTITGFTPSIGTPGTAVTVTGTNFETVPSKNSLRFNNTASAVTSPTTTSLSTTVPGQTGSGRISVATPHGKAVSTADFIIPPSPYTAADVQYTGRMSVDGASHTVIISTANKIGLVVFDGTAGQKVSLGLNSTSISTGSDLWIYNPDGTTLSGTSILNNGGGNNNFHMTLPATGTYTIMVDPDATSTGSVTLTLSSEVNAGTIVVNGSSATIATTRVGQRGYLTFNGTAGQKVSLGLNSSTISTSSDLWIYNPDGSTLTGTGTLNLNGSNNNFHMTLPATGAYTIMVDPDATSTGSVTLTLSSEVDAGTIVVDGASVTMTLSRVGQRGWMNFSGTAGQKVSLGLNSSTISTSSDLWVYNPDGSTLTGTGTLNLGGGNNNFHMTLPATGTYTIMVDPDATSTGSVTLTLSSEVNAGTIVVDGASVTMTLSRVGQRGWMNFSGTAGQKVSLGLNSSTISTSSDLWINNPDGSTLTGTGTLNLGCCNNNFHMTLPATGTYMIMIDPDAASTGSVTLTLSSEVNGGTLTINGSSIPITISRVGQRARLTFTGTASQQATVRLTSNSMGSVAVALLKPDGSQLTSSTSSAGSFNLSTQTLPTTGTYTILVDPAFTNTGSINVAVTSP